MRHMIRHIGGHMPIAMEESSNYECSESHQSGGFFAVTKERRALMYAKLAPRGSEKGSSQKRGGGCKGKAAGSKAEGRGKPADRQ